MPRLSNKVISLLIEAMNDLTDAAAEVDNGEIAAEIQELAFKVDELIDYGEHD